VTTLAEAARKAAYQAGLYMTADVRHRAMEHGWHPEVASNTNIMYDGTQYKVEVHDDFESQAMDLEYGTETMRPTAVIRKYGNNTSQAEHAFMTVLEKDLGVAL